MGQQWLPTIARIVDELDGAYMGTTLYGIVRGMDWGVGHRLDSPTLESLAFDSPQHDYVWGNYRVSYFDNYPKACLPTRSELEVVMLDDGPTSLLVTSTFERHRDGVVVSIHHREGRNSFPVFGPKLLFGGYAEALKEYEKNPLGVPPSIGNEESDMILFTHLALASAVKWRSDKIGTLPRSERLSEPLQKMIRATHDYDQKVHIPHVDD